VSLDTQGFKERQGFPTSILALFERKRREHVGNSELSTSSLVPS
jgi:hypothetical protein